MLRGVFRTKNIAHILATADGHGSDLIRLASIGSTRTVVGLGMIGIGVVFGILGSLALGRREMHA